jgi:hypothetical protein
MTPHLTLQRPSHPRRRLQPERAILGLSFSPDGFCSSHTLPLLRQADAFHFPDTLPLCPQIDTEGDVALPNLEYIFLSTEPGGNLIVRPWPPSPATALLCAQAGRPAPGKRASPCGSARALPMRAQLGSLHSSPCLPLQSPLTPSTSLPALTDPEPADYQRLLPKAQARRTEPAGAIAFSRPEARAQTPFLLLTVCNSRLCLCPRVTQRPACPPLSRHFFRTLGTSPHPLGTCPDDVNVALTRTSAPHPHLTTSPPLVSLRLARWWHSPTTNSTRTTTTTCAAATSSTTP